jgi:hypothetical protein
VYRLSFGGVSGVNIWSLYRARQLMHKQSDDVPRYLSWRLLLGYHVESVGLVWLAGERLRCRKITKGKRNWPKPESRSLRSLGITCTSLSDVTNDFTVDDCKPSIFFLLHLSPSSSNLFKVFDRRMPTV